MDTNGKVALVTGGASGMGQIYARRLAANGATVAIFDVNQQGLDATAAESDNITAFHCDIASLEDVNNKVAQVEEQLGPIDILVHAAALMPAFALAEHSHEGMEKLFRINYFGTTYMVRAVLPSMQARRHGSHHCLRFYCGHCPGAENGCLLRHQGRSERLHRSSPE